MIVLYHGFLICLLVFFTDVCLKEGILLLQLCDFKVQHQVLRYLQAARVLRLHIIQPFVILVNLVLFEYEFVRLLIEWISDANLLKKFALKVVVVYTLYDKLSLYSENLLLVSGQVVFDKAYNGIIILVAIGQYTLAQLIWNVYWCALADIQDEYLFGEGY